MSATPPVIGHLSAKAARLLAVETLLADPESLHDDVLESCLYLLRERLTEEAGGGPPVRPEAAAPEDRA